MATLRFVDKSLSVFVGNISTAVPHEEVEEVIYELFIQVSFATAETEGALGFLQVACWVRFLNCSGRLQVFV